jgi:hypothetical protein
MHILIIKKNEKKKRAGEVEQGMAQETEHLPSKNKTLSPTVPQKSNNQN